MPQVKKVKEVKPLSGGSMTTEAILEPPLQESEEKGTVPENFAFSMNADTQWKLAKKGGGTIKFTNDEMVFFPNGRLDPSRTKFGKSLTFAVPEGESAGYAYTSDPEVKAMILKSGYFGLKTKYGFWIIGETVLKK